MISFSKVSLQFTKEYYALCGVTLTIEDNQHICLVGEKDSGKTSFLRIIAGLEKDYTGEVYINGKNQKDINYEYDISVGYVPKKGVFFENKTVFENMMYALNVRKNQLTPFEQEELVVSVLTKNNLLEYKDIKVKKLSKIQKYYLAFARLYLRKLDILLVDNIWDLEDDELISLKPIIKTLIKDNKCICVFASNSEQIANDYKMDIHNIHAGIINCHQS